MMSELARRSAKDTIDSRTNRRNFGSNPPDGKKRTMSAGDLTTPPHLQAFPITDEAEEAVRKQYGGGKSARVKG